MKYNLIGKKPELSIKFTINQHVPGIPSPPIVLEESLDLDKASINKKLRISEVINRLCKEINEIKKLGNINNCFKDDNNLIKLINICLGKLCGDFSQEILAVLKILEGIPTVFVANDGPSAIRFLYMILCLKGRLNQSTYWGGYMTMKNLLLIHNGQHGGYQRRTMKTRRTKKTTKRKNK